MLKLYYRTCGDDHELSTEMYALIKNIYDSFGYSLPQGIVNQIENLLEKAEKEGIIV